MATKTFLWRMSSQGAEQVIADLRKVAMTSAEGQRALTALTQASPQLASVQDRVGEKLRGTAAAMREATDRASGLQRAMSVLSGGVSGIAGGGLVGAFATGGAIGLGMAAAAAAVNTVVVGITAIPKAGDAATASLARLNAVIGDLVDAKKVFDDLTAVSRQTGVAVTDSVATFSRFQLAAKDLGVTNAQLVELVGGIQKVGIVSGASAATVTSVTTQLGQALASGVLQGDELRSIMENMPTLVAALARELGVAMGELKAMGAEGKLTSDVVLPALLRVAQQIDPEFQKMPVTIERAQAQFTITKDSILANLDELTQASRIWVGVLEWGNRLIDSARIAVGRGTAAEREAALIAEQSALQKRISEIDATIAERRQGGMPEGHAYLDRLLREREEKDAKFQKNREVLAQSNNERVRKEEADAEEAGERRLQAEISRMEKEYNARREAGDKRIKLAREHNETIAVYQRSADLGIISQAEATRQIAEETKRYNEELARLDGSAKAAAQASAELAKETKKAAEEFRRAQEDAAAVAAELDPSERRGQRYAEQLEKIRGGVATGVFGEDRARELEGLAFKELGTEIKSVQTAVNDSEQAFDRFFDKLTSRTEEAIANWQGFGNLARSVADDLARLVTRQFILNPLAEAGQKAVGGIIGSLFGGGYTPVSINPGTQTIITPHARGGVMTSRGPVPLRRYAGGGIATTPQLAMFGEGDVPEAFVPLLDGRSIPVTMRGGGGGFSYRGGDVHIHVANSNASAAMMAAMARQAAEEENRKFVASIQRGGPMAKVTGRRRT